MASLNDGENEYGYTGTHAFMFIIDTGTSSVSDFINGGEESEGLRNMMTPEGPVVFASETAGPSKAFVHLRRESLGQLQDFLADPLWNGVKFDLVTEGPVYTNALNIPFGGKRYPCDFIAVIRVWAEAGRAREVLGRLGDEIGETFQGASIVYGSCDIVLVLEGESHKIVAQAALGKLQRIAGVARTETMFADLTRYQEDEPEV